MLRRRFILLALALLIFFLPTRLGSWLRNQTVHLVSPLGASLVGHSSHLTTVWENLRSIPHLQQERADLQAQVVGLQQQLSDSEELRQENSVLRTELGVTGVTQPYHKVLAKVVVRGSDPSDSTFTVNVGSAQGVHLGQPAVVEGFLIGRVLTVRENSAVIRSITSSQSQVQVWLSTTRDKGLLTGDGVAVSIGDLQQGVQVPAKSIIETSGLGGSLPQGILVGTTSATLSKPNDAIQRFQVDIPHDPSSVESVFILTDSL